MKHAFTAYILSAGAALAHAGHDEAVVHGDAHWLMTGDHVIVLILGAGLLGMGAYRLIRRLARKRAKA